MIDLRSDTVTRPSEAMRRAMAAADVGDDVFGEDPTVLRLQERTAALLGVEAALFVPSGTMANQIAIRVHTEPGDEVLIEENGHSIGFESGGMAGLFGAQPRGLRSDRGLLLPETVAAAIRPRAAHYPRSRLLMLENTHNFGGGTVYPTAQVDALCELAHSKELAVHLDGARLWNAAAARALEPSAWTRGVDSVSVCFSKGLGAPVGSAVCGSRAFVARAHRFRKMLGGGMRQAGVLAAAALYALENNRARLTEDHANAAFLARGLAEIAGVRVEPSETNIVYFEVARDGAAYAADLRAAGVLVHAAGPRRLRAVTHLDVSRGDVERALETFARVPR